MRQPNIGWRGIEVEAKGDELKIPIVLVHGALNLGVNLRISVGHARNSRRADFGEFGHVQKARFRGFHECMNIPESKLCPMEFNRVICENFLE
jgi:hypothetical protein